MDPHSELEIKFRAQRVSIKDFHEMVLSLSNDTPTPSLVQINGFKSIPGRDTYFILNEQPLRLRTGGDRESELTYKQRKSTKSIVDRVEINLPLKYGTNEVSVKKLLGYLGAEEVFCIDKVSHIYNVTGKYGTAEFHATLALYDVTEEGTTKTDRFLEVEVEAASSCSEEIALKVLDKWRRLIKDELDVDGPINESLFEIYNKGK